MFSTDSGRKTILYVDHTAKISGGEIALLNLIGALDCERFRPVVALASDGPLVSRLRQAGVETHVLPLDTSVVETRKDSLGFKSLLRFRQGASCLQYAWHLARFARACGADVIHTNSLKADLYGGLAGRLARIPVIWHIRDHISAHYLPRPVAAAFRGLARFLPHTVVANSESTLRTVQVPRGKHTSVVYSGMAPCSGNEHLQVVHDGFTPVLGQTRAPFASRARLNAVELPPSGRACWESNAPIIALLGRIAPWKGQHIFLRAAATIVRDFPQACFWIIGAPLFGEHDYERSLHDLTAELGIESQVSFLGFQDNVPQLLAGVDIVVHASTLDEPFGQVVIEGMAAGRPVIATNGGALPEIITTGRTGLLVPMGDVAAMAEAMAMLLADPKQAQAMGAAGQKSVQERFTSAQTARKMEAVYEHVLAGRSSAALPETAAHST